MARKKYYAVVLGVQPGVYDNWPEAEAQVKGYPGALFKGFTAKEDAKKWLQNPVSPTVAPKAKKKINKSTIHPSPKDGEVTIYTDGGSINNPGPGGYGAVLINGEKSRELAGGFKLTTNNRMELMACIVALRELPWRDKPINLFSDSSYVVNGITKGWAKKWQKNGWIKSDKKPAVNPDLWEILLDLVEELQVTFSWVKGHAGNPLNERCDELAVASARQKGLPVDKGYEGSQNR